MQQGEHRRNERGRQKIRELKRSEQISSAAGSTKLRMLLLAALLCVPMVASVPWHQSCMCDSGVCTCDWLKHRSIDSICVMKQGNETCYQVEYSSHPRHLDTKAPGCICSSTQCICRFGDDMEDAKICVKSAEATRCSVPRPRGHWANECVCSGGLCTCTWLQRRGKVCILQPRQNLCIKVEQCSTSPNPTRRCCVCLTPQCICDFGRVEDGAQICSKPSSGFTCTTPKRLDEKVLQTINQCICVGAVCICPLMGGTDKVCLLLKGEKPCFPVKQVEGLSSNRLPDAEGCACSQQQCVCTFGVHRAELRGATLCFHSTSPYSEKCVLARPVCNLGDNRETDVPCDSVRSPDTCINHGGKMAKSGEFKYVASLHVCDTYKTQHPKNSSPTACSGSLITPQKILTAASCNFYQHVQIYWCHKAQVGSIYQDCRVGDHCQTQVVRKQILHPHYHVKNGVPRNDLSLLFLNGDLAVTDYVQPISMHIRATENLAGFVTGWGLRRYKPDEEQYKVLHSIATVILPRHLCILYFPDLDDRSMCVTSRFRGKVGCVADAGSGAVIGDSLVGVVSTSRTTDIGYVSLVMNVSSYMHFILTPT